MNNSENINISCAFFPKSIKGANQAANGANQPNELNQAGNAPDVNDSDVDEVQSLLQSSVSDLEWSDNEVPRPKKA